MGTPADVSTNRHHLRIPVRVTLIGRTLWGNGVFSPDNRWVINENFLTRRRPLLPLPVCEKSPRRTNVFVRAKQHVQKIFIFFPVNQNKSETSSALTWLYKQQRSNKKKSQTPCEIYFIGKDNYGVSETFKKRIRFLFRRRWSFKSSFEPGVFKSLTDKTLLFSSFPWRDVKVKRSSNGFQR